MVPGKSGRKLTKTKLERPSNVGRKQTNFHQAPTSIVEADFPRILKKEKENASLKRNKSSLRGIPR